MTFTIELSPEKEKAVRAIPDIHQRMEDFLDDQIKLERWRESRGYSDTANRLAEESRIEAERLRAEGSLTREEAFKMFREVHDDITQKL